MITRTLGLFYCRTTFCINVCDFLLTFLTRLIWTNLGNLWQMDYCRSSVLLSESIIIWFNTLSLIFLERTLFKLPPVKSSFSIKIWITYQLILISSDSDEYSFWENKSTEFFCLQVSNWRRGAICVLPFHYMDPWLVLVH